MRNFSLFVIATILLISCRKDNIGGSLTGPAESSNATVGERVYNMKNGIDPYLPKWSDTMYAARVKNGTAKLFMGNSQIERMIWYNWDATWRDSLAINRGIGGTTWSEKIPYYPQLIYDYKPGDAVFYDGDNEYLRWTQSTRKVSSTIIPQFNRAMDSATRNMPLMRIFICSMLTSPKLAVRGFGGDIDSLNAAYKARVATDNLKFPGRMHFVDLRAIYPTSSAKWETDSIHIKGSYYYEFFNKLKSVFATTPKYVPAGTSAPPPPSNILPVARAGSDVSTFKNWILLNGSNSTDADGSIKAYKWSFISGPSQYSITSPNSSKTYVKNMVTGVYVFRLTVTDNSNATATDDIKVTVKIR
ncbi:MAG TPA: PKD domain-containing protein [Flavitalea sp.]|nr:PKD domain-containing protein [Flavitalea sp.]